MALFLKRVEYATVVFDTTAFLVPSKLDHTAFNQKLNEYGEQGWELVNLLELGRGGNTLEVVALRRVAVK